MHAVPPIFTHCKNESPTHFFLTFKIDKLAKSGPSIFVSNKNA